MRVIYVSGKYRGKDENEVFENIVRAREVAVKLWLDGWGVICPHTNSFFMGSKLGDKMFIEGDLEILRRSDAIYMLKGWEQSEGARLEYNCAVELGLEIYREVG